MIVVDTSALIAILFQEPEATAFNECLYRSDEACIGAPNAFEFLMVARGRRKVMADGSARTLLATPGLVTVPWTSHHADAAFEAFARYGKGNHPAKLNFGDCMAYALAKSLGAPLLFKGNDFRQTDIVAAV